MVIEYIEKSWAVYRRNFWPIVTAVLLQFLIVFIPAIIGIVPWIFVFLAFKGTSITTLLLSNLWLLCFSAVMIIISVLLSVALNGGFVRMLYESFRGKTRYETMIETAKKKFWTIIGANSLVVLVLLSIIIAIFLPLVLILKGFFPTMVSSTTSLPLLITVISIVGLGTILLVLVSIFFTFVNQAIVIDNFNAIPAINRSFEVSKKCYLTILGLMFIFILINSALSTIFSIIGSALEWFVTMPLLLLSYISLYLEKSRKK